MDFMNRPGGDSVCAAVASIGCKVSQYDAKTAEGALAAAGYEIVPFSERADVYVICTCAVTETAAGKSRNAVKRALKKNPEALALVIGCWARLEPEAVLAIGARPVQGDLVRELEELLGRNERESTAPPADAPVIRPRRERTRAYLKIQDGCDNFCSYCVIPYARGRVQSRESGEILREAESLAANGYKEIVLTGIHVASYGKDLKKGSLLDICRIVSGVGGIERVRLSSLSPQGITEEFVNGIAELKICPHFHLSLQSGAASTLRAMNRGYTPEDYARAVRLLDSAFPGCAVWSDVIAGFPGESDEDFNESVSFIEGSGIVKLHVFPFSPRKGTKAYDMTPRLGRETAAKRVNVLIELDTRLYGEYLKRNEGMVRTVLYEERAGEYLAGHTENYIYVRVPLSGSNVNDAASVRLGNAVRGKKGFEVYAEEL